MLIHASNRLPCQRSGRLRTLEYPQDGHGPQLDLDFLAIFWQCISLELYTVNLHALCSYPPRSRLQAPI